MNKLKDLRLGIDELAQLLEITKDNVVYSTTRITMQAPDVHQAERSARFAKAWAGKLAGELGQENPYKNDGKRESVADIEPVDSVAVLGGNSAVAANYVSSGTYVAKIDFLRGLAQDLADQARHFDKSENITLDTREKNICRTQVWIHLTEVKINLGLELGRLLKDSLKIAA